MRVMVTGATGLIGRAVGKQLESQGHQLSILTARFRTLASHPKGHDVRVHMWMPELERPPKDIWNGVDAVIHLAGEPIMGRWNKDKIKRIRDSRIKGTYHLTESMMRAPHRPKTFICASAVGYYGDRGDEFLDETAKPGRGFFADLARDWEMTASRAQDVGIRTCYVRTGVVLSREGGALENMLTPFKLGLGGRIGSGEQWFPWIHIDDIANLFLHALNANYLKGPINGVSPGIVKNSAFAKELAHCLHKPAFIPVPKTALRVMLGQVATEITSSHYVSPKVALDSGFQFKFPELKIALQNLLDS